MQPRGRACLLIALALAASACVPPEPEDVVRKFDPDTLLGQIQAQGTISIGMPQVPPLAFVSREGVPLAGLLPDLGRHLADQLGVRPEFIVNPPDELLVLLDQGAADIVFTIDPITESRVRKYLYTDPWWVGHQRLLVTKDSKIDSIDDLSGATVCSLIDPETGLALDKLDPDIETITAGLRACLILLDAEEIAAITGPDALLLHAVAAAKRKYEIVGDELTTEAYGGAVAKSSAGLADFTSTVMERAKNAGLWEEWLEEWVGAHTNSVDTTPPDLTVEEAAALFPTG